MQRRAPAPRPAFLRCFAPGLRRCIRVALVLTSLMLVACAGADPALRITDLRIADDRLEMSLRLDLPDEVVRGLARGVPLSFRCDLSDRSGQRSSHLRELRFLPLSRHYQLREPASGFSRSYASRAAALAALEFWPLPFASEDGDTDAARSLRARVYLDRGRLPSPLALSAVFDRDWHLDSGVVAWPVAQR